MQTKTDSLSQNRLLKQMQQDTDDQHLFVMNNTANVPALGNVPGQIGFSVQVDGRLTTIIIPEGFAPFDLSLQAPKKAILSSPELMKGVSGGSFYLVPTKEALDLLDKDADILEEHNRMNGFASMAAQAVATEDAPQPEIQAWVIEAMGAQVTESQAYSTVRNRQAALTAADCEHIRTNSKSERIKQIAVERLNNLRTAAA